MRVHELTVRVSVVSRGAGRSATAAAAYRAGVRIEDQRTGQVHDYTRKRGIEDEAMLLPDNAPEWAHDRGKLFNEAELREKHPRAQTARDLTVAFPSEFSPEQRKEAGLRIAQGLVDRYGVAVDVVWHAPSRKGDERNHHMHALMTTRRWNEKSEWADTKDRTLDDLKKGPEEVRGIRLSVADTLNNIAARDGLEVYVEHLSFETRALDREPTQHMGPIATKMQREGRQTDIGDKNQEIASRNQQRRQLRDERKVIDIEVAREELAAKRSGEAQEHGRGAEGPQTSLDDQEAYTAFYRDAQARRAALLTDLDRRHGSEEKRLRQEIAGLTNTLENSGFLSRVWRGITGRAKADRERLVAAGRALERLRTDRLAAHEQLERDRLHRLEELKAAMVRHELERERNAQEAERLRAVGERPVATKRTHLPTREEYDRRRREYFQRLGAQRKLEREAERQVVEGRSDSPAPAWDFERAADNPAAPGGDVAPAPTDEKAAERERRREYFRRLSRDREANRDKGPMLER